MGKLFGIAVIVAVLYVAAELFTNGVDGAFGGVFASDQAVAAAPRSTPRRFGDAARRAQAENNARRDAILAE